jgi:hypothetical protein
MTITNHVPVHLGSPDDLLAAVPTLLGTHPSERPVLIGVTEDKVVAASSVDLGALAMPGVLVALFRATRRSVATSVIVVLYTEAKVNTALLAEPLHQCAEHVGLVLRAGVVVAGGQMRPLSADPSRGAAATRPVRIEPRHV